MFLHILKTKKRDKGLKMDQIVCITCMGYCGDSVVTMGNQQHWEITIF